MRQGFEKLYGYTSDSDGIRHAILDEPKSEQNEARYMLVRVQSLPIFLFH